MPEATPGELMDDFIRRAAGRIPEPPPAPATGAGAPAAGSTEALLRDLTAGWSATPADVQALLGDVEGTDLRDAVRKLGEAKPYLIDGPPAPPSPFGGGADQGRQGHDRRDRMHGQPSDDIDEIIRHAAGRYY